MKLTDSKSVLIVIDHREARVYTAVLSDAVPSKVLSLDPHGPHRYLHNVGDEDNGERKPEYEKFYQDVIAALAGADKILIFGHGRGATAMKHLVDDLKKHRPLLAQKIIGAEPVDLVHLTEHQLLAKARDFFQAHLGQSVQSA